MNLNQQRQLFQNLRSDPAAHIEQIQGVSTLTEFQTRIAREIAAHDRIAISACHDVGKTFLVSKMVLWFGSVFRGSKIITTAPTWTQVEHLLWSEIRAGYSNSKIRLGGRMLTTEWKIDSDWFAIGLSPKDDADTSGGGQGATSGFQGFHAPYILVIFDEATGVPSKRWIQAQGMLTSANVKFVAIGNPTTKNCEFFKCFQSRLWRKIYISCFDSPNLQANGIFNISDLEKELNVLRELSEEKAFERIKSYKVVVPALITLSWVVDRAFVWGLKHPLFISKVLGQFPDEDDSTLIPLGVVENAQRRLPPPKSNGRCGIGVDVARYGSDKSVITSILGDQVMPSRVMVKKDTMEIAGQTVREIDDRIKAGTYPSLISVGVDATGIGSGVVDSLLESQRNGIIHREVTIVEVHFGQGFDYIRDETEREECKGLYINRKAKLYVELASDLKNALCLPEDSVYLEELPTIVSEYDSKGRHVIESKEDYRDRTGRSSPDHSDALAIANEMRKQLSPSAGVIRVIR